MEGAAGFNTLCTSAKHEHQHSLIDFSSSCYCQLFLEVFPPFGRSLMAFHFDSLFSCCSGQSRIHGFFCSSSWCLEQSLELLSRTKKVACDAVVTADTTITVISCDRSRREERGRGHWRLHLVLFFVIIMSIIFRWYLADSMSLKIF